MKFGFALFAYDVIIGAVISWEVWHHAHWSVAVVATVALVRWAFHDLADRIEKDLK